MEKEVLYKIGSKDSKFTMYKNGDMKLESETIAIKQPSQLNRVENKVDRILELLESKGLSTSYVTPNVPDNIAKQFNIGKHAIK